MELARAAGEQPLLNQLTSWRLRFSSRLVSGQATTLSKVQVYRETVLSRIVLTDLHFSRHSVSKDHITHIRPWNQAIKGVTGNQRQHRGG